MLLRLPQTHVGKSIILIRTEAILFFMQICFTKPMEMVFIDLVCQDMIKKLIFNYD